MPLKNKLILVLLQLLFLPILYLILPPVLIRKYPGPASLPSSTVLPLVAGTVYQAEFSYPKSYFSCNFKSVSLVLKNPNLKNRSSLLLRFSSPQNITYEYSTSGQSIGDPETLNFVFPHPIACTPGIYRLSLTTTNTDPGSLQVYGESEKHLNFQTQISYPNFKTAFQQNLQYQLAKLFTLNYFLTSIWLILILLLNYLIFV